MREAALERSASPCFSFARDQKTRTSGGLKRQPMPVCGYWGNEKMQKVSVERVVTVGA